jgi:hypothetical protein
MSDLERASAVVNADSNRSFCISERELEEISRALGLGFAYADVLRRHNYVPPIPPDDDFKFIEDTHNSLVARLSD